MTSSPPTKAQINRELREREVPRPEYPRPQLRRDRWTNLNGLWRFTFDESDVGLLWHWQRVSAVELESSGGPFVDRILVPFCPESSLSGIGDRKLHRIAWYGRTFPTPPHSEAERVLLNFGAVDYWAEVWVNGELAVRHEGGHTPFSADITRFLAGTSNTVVVRAEDPGDDPTIPRGKQDWKEKPSHIFYSRTTGIWQTVWLEVVNAIHIDKLRLTPIVDDSMVDVGIRLSNWRPGTHVRLQTEIDGQLAETGTYAASGPEFNVSLEVPGASVQLWSPDRPALYELTVEVTDPQQQTVDFVNSYFGMRKVEVVGGRLQLNGSSIFLRHVLDQGYWPDGLLTAPSDEALRRDIELAIAMGFNGARKHQKVEDPRWLYWADRLGFLVWEEMPNAHSFSPNAVVRTINEWAQVIERDVSHPCIITWVPINESNGCRFLGADQRSPEGTFQADFASSMYYLTKALDPTRPALSNDGWEHTRSDFCTVHDYRELRVLAERVGSVKGLLTSPLASRPVFAMGHRYGGQPFLVTEYGGIFDGSAVAGFDYAVAADEPGLEHQLASLTGVLMACALISGFCYTQLVDVEHEKNGLLTADRHAKVNLSAIKAIITASAAGAGVR